MTYTKTVWQDGDIITAQKMNNIENGIESAGNESSEPIIITATFDENAYVSLDKTWQEIHDNFLAGKLQIVKNVAYNDSEYYKVSDTYGTVVGIYERTDTTDNSIFKIIYTNYGNFVELNAATKDSYPGGDFS